MAKVHVQKEENLSDLDSGSEADVESEDVSDASDQELSDDGNKKSGMADAMARILGKQVPSKKNVILAKGMTDKQIERKRKLKEGGEKDEVDKKKIYIDQVTRQAKKKEWENRGRMKPQPLERTTEKVLQRIATRGIVQLFNAVRKQQKLLDDQLVEAGSSERRKDKVVESMTKGKFLDILKGTASKSEDSKNTKNINKQKQRETNENIEDSVEEEEDSKWSILRDDFMMGATMKDWDKEGSDGEEVPDD
ncbi:RRP15-like protein [Patella vulgata]|uniref:RRP15-like protein n=1 Tax=Patella vulgata TaxID=6465 RepID=UPI00217FC0D0|nr:RRP15-like protein [Patella vulgata]